MQDRPRPRGSMRRSVRAILAWGLSLLLAAGAMALWQQQALVRQLEEESGALNRLVSQRAGQHDAHLTALSAIAAASAEPARDLFLEVASTITHFYPRIDDVQLVALDPHGPVIGTGPLAPDVADRVRAAARASTGDIALMPYPGRAHHYMMIKRSPNTSGARHGLMLGIDAGKLLDEAGAFWHRPGAVLALSMPDGRPLAGQVHPAGAVRSGRVIGSASQPLVLETGLGRLGRSAAAGADRAAARPRQSFPLGGARRLAAAGARPRGGGTGADQRAGIAAGPCVAGQCAGRDGQRPDA